MKKYLSKNFIFFFLFNFFGIFVFFIPIKIYSKKTIIIDHISNFLLNYFSKEISIYVVILMILGIYFSFFKLKKGNFSSYIFFTFNIFGIILYIMFLSEFGPVFLFKDNMLPFLIKKLIFPLSIIIPIGAIFLIFLVNFGLLEFMGVLMENIMRPLFKTSGKSSIDAVASFVGSYSIGLLITNKVYTDGKYTLKEACIIATGFSTVSVTFMIIVAKTLSLLSYWNLYFWSCIFITFLVTAITVRLYPLKNKPETYFNNINNNPKIEKKINLLTTAFNMGLESCSENISHFPILLFKSFLDGIKMTSTLVSSITSIGLLGLILANYTPLFNIIALIFYPFTKILNFTEPFLVAKILSTSLAEMFLPSIFAINLDLSSKFVIAIVSISEILFFSASIPCILSTEIKISIKEIIILWIERVVLSLILATIFAKIFL